MGEGLDIHCLLPHHHPLHHHMMGAPPPPGYAMMGPAHPHDMPPLPSKHNSLPQGKGV